MRFSPCKREREIGGERQISRETNAASFEEGSLCATPPPSLRACGGSSKLVMKKGIMNMANHPHG
jgi:hypothetical protein